MICALSCDLPGMILGGLVASAGVTLPAGVAAAANEVAEGAPAATAIIPVSVHFPLTHTAELEQLLADLVDPTKPQTYHHWLTPAQFQAAYGPAPSAVARIKAVLTAAGMRITAEHTQSLDVVGPASAVQALFGIHLT